MSHAGGGDKWNHSQLFQPPAAHTDHHRLLSMRPLPLPRLLRASLEVHASGRASPMESLMSKSPG